MKVLVLSSLYPKRYNPGSGIFVARQLHAMQTVGVDIAAVISPVPWMPSLPNAGWLARRWQAYLAEPDCWADSGGFPVYQPRVPALPRQLGFPLYGELFRLGLRATVRELWSQARFDLIHAHVAFPVGAAALRLGAEYGVPVVVTVHGQDLQVSIHRNRLTRHMVAHVLGDADQVVLVSRKLHDIVNRERLPGRYTVVPNAIDLAGPVDKAFSDHLRGKRPAGRLLLSVGNLIPSKGHEWVLRALGPGDSYWIVGDGPERRRLEQLAKDLNVIHRVHFWGRVPPQQVSAFMHTADVFVLPSAPEAFGLVYLEAMSAGLPVIACLGEGDPDLLVDNVTALLVGPRNPQSIAGALHRLEVEAGLGQRLAFAASQRVLAEYSLEVQARRLAGLYDELISGHS